MTANDHCNVHNMVAVYFTLIMRCCGSHCRIRYIVITFFAIKQETYILLLLLLKSACTISICKKCVAASLATKYCHTDYTKCYTSIFPHLKNFLFILGLFNKAK